jgi:hypothetical protein
MMGGCGIEEYTDVVVDKRIGVKGNIFGGNKRKQISLFSYLLETIRLYG